MPSLCASACKLRLCLVCHLKRKHAGNEKQKLHSSLNLYILEWRGGVRTALIKGMKTELCLGEVLLPPVVRIQSSFLALESGECFLSKSSSPPSWLSQSLPPALPHLHLVVLPIKAALVLSPAGPSTFSLGRSTCLFPLSSWCLMLLLPCCSRWQLLPVGCVNEETSKSKSHRRLLLLTSQKPSD